MYPAWLIGSRAVALMGNPRKKPAACARFGFRTSGGRHARERIGLLMETHMPTNFQCRVIRAVCKFAINGFRHFHIRRPLVLVWAI
jgi:hypothetical protein